MTTPSGQDPFAAGPQAPPAQGYGPPPQGYGPPQGWQPAPGGPVSSDDTTWALLAHLSYFVLGLIGPLVIFLVKKDSSPFVRQHSAEALNFHITIMLASIVSFVLMLVLIGFLTLFAVIIAGAVYSVIAAIAANRGQSYRYPLTLRLVK